MHEVSPQPFHDQRPAIQAHDPVTLLAVSFSAGELEQAGATPITAEITTANFAITPTPMHAMITHVAGHRKGCRFVALLAALGACGGGKGGGGPDGNGGGGAGWSVSYGAPAIVFGQGDNAIYRYEDTSGDGDYNEAGETALFWQDTITAGPMVAVDSSTLFFVRNANAGGGAVWLLKDANGDHTIDASEAHAFWNGTLPAGGTTNHLVTIALGPDGSVYALNEVGGTGSQAGQQIIYRLKDGNGNGDANDAGEVTVVTQLATNIYTRSIAVDGNGDVWFGDNEGDIPGGNLYRVRAGTTTLVLDEATLDSEAHIGIVPDRLVTDSSGSIVFAGMASGLTPVSGSVLVALRDANGDHEITIDEVVTIWDYADSDYWCSHEDVAALADGSIVCLHTTHDLMRFVDGNSNGSFNDDGEMYLSLDNTFAQANGQTNSPSLSFAAAVK